MVNIQKLLRDGINYLKNQNITSYNIDAKVLLMNSMNIDKVKLLTSTQDVDAETQAKYNKWLLMRASGMPVAYIVGHVEFMSLPFQVEEGVLIPRGDTEILVERAIEAIKANNYLRMLDIGTGSGCIPISIVNYTGIEALAVDIDETPLRVAKANAINNNCSEKCKFIQSNLFSNIDTNMKFDLITSNPPYISISEMEDLMVDVKEFEPHLALVGGEDGLDFYRKITPISYNMINKGGMLIYEIGMSQGEQVKEILENNGFSQVEILCDLQKLNRVVLGMKE